MAPPDEHDLAAIALELAVRVRDEPAEDNGRWLGERLPDPNDRTRLAFVLAAAIPIDKPWLHLTAWTVMRPASVGVPAADDPKPKPRRKNRNPCGTRAAAERHRYHGEEPCDPCREAERAYDRQRNRRAAA